MRVDEALRILEIPPSATPAEIKAAYRRIVKVCHPDRHALDEGRRARAEETLKRVVQAYQCLRHGVPAAPPPEPKAATTEKPGSAYSVRNAPPPRRRRSEPRNKTSAASWRWYLAVSLPVVAALGALLVSLSAGLNPAVRVSEPVSYSSHTPVFPEVRHRDRAWDILNPTERTWSDCSASAGDKWLSFKTLKPGEEIRLQAIDFSGPPGPLDANSRLDIRCLRH